MSEAYQASSIMGGHAERTSFFRAPVSFSRGRSITPFAVHLQKISLHLSPNLFHYGQYTLIN